MAVERFFSLLLLGSANHPQAGRRKIRCFARVKSPQPSPFGELHRNTAYKRQAQRLPVSGSASSCTSPPTPRRPSPAAVRSKGGRLQTRRLPLARRTHLRVARPVPAPQQRARKNHRFRWGVALVRDDAPGRNPWPVPPPARGRSQHAASPAPGPILEDRLPMHRKRRGRRARQRRPLAPQTLVRGETKRPLRWTSPKPASSSRTLVVNTTNVGPTANSATRAPHALPPNFHRSPRLPSWTLDNPPSINYKLTSPPTNSLPGSRKRVPSQSHKHCHRKLRCNRGGRSPSESPAWYSCQVKCIETLRLSKRVI